MKPESKALRYRVEGDRICIDIRLRRIQQFFDGRDPAPFRERDLDPSAVEYLFAAAEEIPLPEALKVVLTVDSSEYRMVSASEIECAIRAHFDYEHEQVNRRLRHQRRFGQVALGAGLAVLVLFLSLAQLTQRLSPGPPREILREGLVITGWVAMWRPIELLLFDWWPLAQKRRQVSRLRSAEISVRTIDTERADAAFG